MKNHKGNDVPCSLVSILGNIQIVAWLRCPGLILYDDNSKSKAVSHQGLERPPNRKLSQILFYKRAFRIKRTYYYPSLFLDFVSFRADKKNV